MNNHHRPVLVQMIPVVSERYGGPSIGSVALNAALRRSGVDATLYSTSLNGADSELGRSDHARLGSAGAHVVLCRPSFPKRFQHSWSLLARLFREVKHADVLHMHGQYQAPHVFSYLLARCWSVPYGIQLHGGLEPYQRRVSDGRKSVYNAIVGTRILRNASYVMFASESEAENAADVIPTEKAVITPLGAQLETPVPQVSIENALDGIDRSDCFLFLGRLASKKRPDLLLEAWSKAKKPRTARLIIAGPNDDFDTSSLTAMAERLGISDSVMCLGPVVGAHKAWLYSRCGVFVLASENENFGITVAEAMLAGCHVIASRGVAASQHLMQAGGGRVIAQMDTIRLSKALEEGFGSQVAIQASGRKLQEYARDNLTWDATAANLNKALDALGLHWNGIV